MSELTKNEVPWALELLGISYRTAPLEVLEGLALSPEEIKAFYERVREIEGLESAMVLSTCNRTEIYGLNVSQQPIAERLIQLLCDITGPSRFPTPDRLYRAHGRDSLSHLFRVASGLDSAILGEAQILGQMKEAFEQSSTFKPPSPPFERLVRAAFAAAKRSRTETEIGKGAVSVASAAVHVATRIFADLSKHTVVILGAGDTGRLVVEHFQAHRPRRYLIVNRTLERAESLARAVGGVALPWEKLEDALAEGDVVACAVRAPAPVIDKAVLERARAHRSGHVLALLDLGLPRNIAPDVNDVKNVFVADLDAFRQVVDGNLGRRKREVPRVEAIIDEEIDRLFEWHRSAQVGPLITALRESVEGMRRAEVDKACAGMSDAERAAVERATRAVVNKLLHGPTTTLKEIAKKGERPERLEEVRHLVSRFFGADGAPKS